MSTARCPRALSLVFGLSIAAAAHAQPSPAPEIEFSNIERKLYVAVDADGAGPFDERVSTRQGAFVDRLSFTASGPDGSAAEAEASQKSEVSRFSVRGRGEARGSASLGGAPFANVRASANSSIFLELTVPIDAPYTLSGTFTATGASSIHANAAVALLATGADGNIIWHNAGYSPACSCPPSFFFTGQVKAGSTLTFSIEAGVDPQGKDDELPDFLGEGTASFEFLLDFGDRDGDGLLDSWEEEGIDFDGVAPTDIDLPALGADPDKRDLFVEIDVMEGVSLDRLALVMVADVFASAPAEMVDNPNGEKGIRLHLIHDDGDRPPATPMNGDDWTDYYALKAQFFGSPADRSHVYSTEILEARRAIFRYCLWADTLEDSKGPFAGQADGIPGNDLIVGAGYLGRRFPDDRTKTLAATLMHELGHTIGLQHGGQDGVNLKPNYLSVMNYIYAFPYDLDTAQGTNLRDIWRLDFSRSALVTLDETALSETQSLGGPRYRKIVFNSGFENFPEPIVRTIADADGAVDWNNNGAPGEPQTYQLDVNRFREAVPASYQKSLESFTDWDRLWYHLSGGTQFSKLAEIAGETPEPDLEEWVFDELLGQPWVDQTDPSLIFADDFESASTLAWSSAVP